MVIKINDLVLDIKLKEYGTQQFCYIVDMLPHFIIDEKKPIIAILDDCEYGKVLCSNDSEMIIDFPRQPSPWFRLRIY